jgi:hypothetical protein
MPNIIQASSSTAGVDAAVDYGCLLQINPTHQQRANQQATTAGQ